MKNDHKGRAVWRAVAGSSFVLFASSILALLVSGCGGKVEDKFAAESYDEYTERLTNALIVGPTGVVTVVTDAGVSVPSSAEGAGGSPGVASPGGGSVSVGSGGGASTGGTSSGAGGSSGSASGTSSSGPSGGVGASSGEGKGGTGSSPASDGGLFGDAEAGDGGSGGGFGFWHFDDCSPTSNFLVDSSGEGHDAQHALGAACVPGISGLAVDFRSAKDVVQVPDEPEFTVGPRVAVAAWVNPTTVKGDQPIILKRLNNSTSFSLGIHNGNIEMSVVLTTGKTIISQAPITAGTWTHVAGLYDGTFVFLFINGQQFGQIYAAGTLRDVFAPIRIGATTQSQFFHGDIDEVFISTEVVTAQQIAALSCISRPSTLAVSPLTSPPVPFNTSVHYDVTVTDNDLGSCQLKFYNFFFEQVPVGINISFDSSTFQSVSNPGQTVDFGVDLSATDEVDPGLYELPFGVVNEFGPTFEELNGELTFDLATPSGCFVSTRRELMITDTSIVDDPVRTAGSTTGQGFDAGVVSASDAGVVSVPVPLPLALVARTLPSTGDASTATDAASTTDAVAIDAGSSPSLGVWTFGHLMRDMAPTPADAPAMTLQLFQHWLTNQTVNQFTVLARPAIQQVLLDIWPKTVTGDLDLDQAPLSLQAIVNRIDLRNLSSGSAGEGRFVFAVNAPFAPQQFTVILEYNLPAQTQADVQNWANLWHGLASHPFPSEEYNAALEDITRRFAGRGALPSGVNGSALLSLRTNEIALSGNQWELRQFALDPGTQFLAEIPVGETPDITFNGTSTFADFVNQNASAIEALLPGATGNTVPPVFEGLNFQGGSALNGTNPFIPIVWSAPGIADPEARFHASMNTCNGCHGPDTGSSFLQITPRFPGSQATLSPFLTGTTFSDPISGEIRTLNDLGRRNTDLTGLVCPSDGGSPPPVDAGVPTADASDDGPFIVPPPPILPFATN